MLQENRKKEEREEAFGALDASVKKYSTLGEPGVFGELNAKPGKPVDPKEKKLLGKFGEPGGRRALSSG